MAKRYYRYIQTKKSKINMATKRKRQTKTIVQKTKQKNEK